MVNIVTWTREEPKRKQNFLLFNKKNLLCCWTSHFVKKSEIFAGMDCKSWLLLSYCALYDLNLMLSWKSSCQLKAERLINWTCERSLMIAFICADEKISAFIKQNFCGYNPSFYLSIKISSILHLHRILPSKYIKKTPHEIMRTTKIYSLFLFKKKQIIFFSKLKNSFHKQNLSIHTIL